MKISVVSHGVKYLFKDDSRMSCPECDYIALAAADTWKSIELLKKQSGRAYGARYECSRCLCVFDCLESMT